MGRPLVLCALEIERAAAARAARGVADVVRFGPGPAAVRAWGEQFDAERSGRGDQTPALVILFGLAGGLMPTGPAPSIGRVIDREGRVWTPPVVAGDPASAVTLLGMDDPVIEPARKHELAARSGAALVDTESHAFAAWADGSGGAGVRWAVIRGVSDGPDEPLPREVTGWIDARGRVRVVRPLLDVIRRPRLAPAVLALSERADAALHAAGERLRALLAREAPKGKNPA